MEQKLLPFFLAQQERMRFIQLPVGVTWKTKRSVTVMLFPVSESINSHILSTGRPEQLLVCQQLLQVLGQHFLLQSQVDPGPGLTHLRETLTHSLDKPRTTQTGMKQCPMF